MMTATNFITGEMWVGTITPETKAAINALASQWIPLEDEIQFKQIFYGALSDVHGVLE